MPAVEQNIICSRWAAGYKTSHSAILHPCTWHYLCETVISSYTCQRWSHSLWWRWWLISVHSQFTSSLRAPFSIHRAENSELMNEGAIADTALFPQQTSVLKALSELCFPVHLLWIRRESCAHRPCFLWMVTLRLLTVPWASSMDSNKSAFFFFCASWIQLKCWNYEQLSSMTRRELIDFLLTFVQNCAARLELTDIPKVENPSLT